MLPVKALEITTKPQTHMKHFAFTPIVASLLLLFTGCSKDRNPSGGTAAH